MDKKVTVSVRVAAGGGAGRPGRRGGVPRRPGGTRARERRDRGRHQHRHGHRRRPRAVVPDQLAFDLSVSVLRDDLDQALDDGNTAMQSVVDTLKASGVADKDVQTTDLSMNPEYEKREGSARRAQGLPGQPQRLGHRRGLRQGERHRHRRARAGGTGVRLNGLRLQVGDPDASLEPARTDAVEQARAKAEEYAAEAGRELGDIVTDQRGRPTSRRTVTSSPTAHAAADRVVPDPGRAAGPDREHRGGLRARVATPVAAPWRPRRARRARRHGPAAASTRRRAAASGLDGRRQGGLLERHPRDADAVALGHRRADQQGAVAVAAHVEEDAREVLAAGEHGVGDVVGEDLGQHPRRTRRTPRRSGPAGAGCRRGCCGRRCWPVRRRAGPPSRSRRPRRRAPPRGPRRR